MLIVRGALLGVINVLVIAISMAFMGHDADPLLLVGFVPLGLGTGALLDAVLWLLVAQRPWLRVLVISIPSIGIVCWLGASHRMLELVPLSCIPTLATAFALERWTRRVDPERIPHAILTRS